MRSNDLLIRGLERLVTESHGDLLERVAGRFDVIRPCQNGRGQTEARNDEIEVSADTSKGVRRDHTNDEVEDLRKR